MILFDGIHLASDKSLAELHTTAQSLGLHYGWFQGRARIPHYDVFGSKAKQLQKNCTPRELAQRAVRK
jgi:hypothetical protein